MIIDLNRCRRIAGGRTGKRYLFAGFLASGLWWCGCAQQDHRNDRVVPASGKKYLVVPTQDFAITGDGRSAPWQAVPWSPLPPRISAKNDYPTRMKLLYSSKGLYGLFDCGDRRMTASMDADFLDLWNEDVVELFLWPDTASATYFEYELSPGNHELALLISNVSGDIVRWQPFHYEADRKTQHQVRLRTADGQLQGISGWTAEFFIPYSLMRPLTGIPPRPGMSWQMNLYRLDYDEDSINPTEWAWQANDSAHDIQHFGQLIFQ